MCQDLLTLLVLRRFDNPMSNCLGQLHIVLHDFRELLQSSVDVKKELEDHSKSSMTLGLYVLLQAYATIRDLILRSLVNPLPFASSELLHVP